MILNNQLLLYLLIINKYKMYSNNNDSVDSLSSNDECKINLAIQIDKKRTEHLSIHQSDNIEEKVNFFCHLHELSSEINKIIINQITEQIEASINNSKLDIIDIL